MVDTTPAVQSGATPMRPVYPLTSDREAAYSYQCNNCKRCCHDKLIQVNPYEVARLAQHLGVSTSTFMRNCVEDNVYLKRQPNGACIFLNAAGCGVHPDRPMVCRIYPLGRHIGGDGTESFTHLDPHPQSAGEYGQSKRIEDYLMQQGALPYMAAADHYLALFHSLHAMLLVSVAAAPQAAGTLDQAASAAKTDIPAWLDVDQVVENYCAAHGVAPPDAVSEKMEFHIAAIEEWIAAQRQAPPP